jgi:hypothetical protein
MNRAHTRQDVPVRKILPVLPNDFARGPRRPRLGAWFQTPESERGADQAPHPAAL